MAEQLLRISALGTGQWHLGYQCLVLTGMVCTYKLRRAFRVPRDPPCRGLRPGLRVNRQFRLYLVLITLPSTVQRRPVAAVQPYSRLASMLRPT